MQHRTTTSNSQRSPSEQQSFLSRYKEDISSRQKSIRERLGIEPTVDNRQPSTSNLDEPLRALYTSSIPSIDGDVMEQITTSSVRERNNYRSSRSSFFNDDPEESLQFFKKNLMPKSAQNETSKPIATTTKSPIRRLQSTPRTSSNILLDRPTFSSSRNAIDDDDGINSDARYNRQSDFRTPTPPPPPIISSSNRYSDRDNRDSPSPIMAKSRPLPIKQTSLNEPRFERAIRQQQELTINEKPTTARQVFNDSDQLPRRNPSANHPVSSKKRQQQQSEPATTNDPSYTINIDETQQQQRSFRRPLKVDNHLRRVETEPKELVSVPTHRSPEPFSRKPLYHSLFRAHDSIRLKVNRPKIRPKSEANIQDDTCIDDDDAGEYDENRPKNQEVESEDKQQQKQDGLGVLNERPVDVLKRWSFRRRSSKSKKNKEIEANKQPVRNFQDVRVIKILRSEEERSIGVTVRAEDGNIIVARIMAGSLADKQGVLQVGDIILTVNNREVYTPEQLQEEIRKTMNDDHVLMKIVPSFREELPTLCIYLRALFAYDPNEDSLLPCKEVGVAFNQGDILEVVNQEDPNWWQARRVESENLQTGLIPSQELEERRRAFVLPDYDLATRTSICGTRVTRKSKKKEIYNIGLNNDFDKAELQLYEEVCRTPPFERRTLVLIGPNGVGKQALKARLLAMDPDRFGSSLAHTSRLPREGEEDGVHYHFVTRERMEEDIIDGKYLEYGEFDGALYGTKLDSIREIIGQGKICVLDCSPTCLKILKTPDYLPFVAFIAAPTLDQFRYLQNDFLKGSNRGVYGTFDRALSRQSRRAKTLQDFAFDFFEDEDLQVTIEESARLLRMYENYFDIVLVNNHYDRTYEQLRDAIDALSMAPQWIPISWIYGS